MKLNLLLLLLLLLSCSAFSQNPPKIERSGGQIVEITNLTGSVPDMKCTVPSLLKGTVAQKWYEKDDQTIAGFILSTAKDKETSILLNNAQVKLLGQYSGETMSSIIKNGKRLQIWTYECVNRDSATFIYANRIKPL